MSPEMIERVNMAIRLCLADSAELSADYLDQCQKHEILEGGKRLFAAYTPWGVANIEAAFIDRMQSPTPWDSKQLIRRDILSNQHLSLNLKDRLLQIFETTDWTRWHDGYFAKCIQQNQNDTLALQKLSNQIQESQHLSQKSRENLLFNIKTYLEMLTQPCEQM